MHRVRSLATREAIDRNVDHSPRNSLTPHSTRSAPIRLNDGSTELSPGSPAPPQPNAEDGARRTAGSSTKNKYAANNASAAPAAPAAPPAGNEKESQEPSSLTPEKKPSILARLKGGSIRFLHHTKDALLHSWINVLLIFVPLGIAVNYAPINHEQKASIVFAFNAVAIVPLAGLLAHATESVASNMGDTWASLLNVSFGNAVELIIFIIILSKNQIPVLQATVLGSILANLLLILGMSFLLGGLRFQEQIYNSTVTQMSACLLSLSVMSLLLPTAFHATFKDSDLADATTLKVSRGTSVVLLLVYVLYLLFQLKSHAYMYQSTPQHVIDEEAQPGVLADIMNYSGSSDDSDSSSSSDSDSSLGSHTTAKSRFKRAFRRRRRKSSFSSNKTVSAQSSPSVEKKSVFEGATTPPTEGYFDNNVEDRDDPYASTAVFSGDEADTDGERDYGITRIRDFEAEHAESVKSPTRKSPEKKMKAKSKKEKKREKKREKAEPEASWAKKSTEKVSIPESSQEQPLPVDSDGLRVGFIEEIQGEQHSSAPKRPFSRRQLSQLPRPAFMPPLPGLLSNTVFSSAKPPAAGTMYPARSAESALRRTSSLPDRLNETHQVNGRTIRPHRTPIYPFKAPVATVQPGAAAINEVDAAEKDAAHDGKPPMSRTAAVILLLASTGLVAFCAELLVEAIPEMTAHSTVSQTFIGLIILPIVGNAAEHVTAVVVATKNKMDLAIGVAVGSSIQIALFVTPFVVILGWIMGKDMSLYFNIFETISLFVTAFVVNFLVLDGRSNYLEGSLLIAAYVIIAVAAFFYPNTQQASPIGGGGAEMNFAKMMMG